MYVKNFFTLTLSAVSSPPGRSSSPAEMDEGKKAQFLSLAKEQIERYLVEQYRAKKITDEIYNKAIVATYRNLEFWATDDHIKRLSPKTQEAIFEAIEAGRWKDIVEVFRQDITFGTAGIRGKAALTKEELFILKEEGPSAKILKGPNTINDIVLLRYTTGVVRYAQEKGLHKVIIGYDSRIAGREFAEIIAQCFLGQSSPEHKFTVYLFDEASPFPELSFGITTKEVRADLGILISASHNPSDYNGYKITDFKGSQLPQAMKDEVTAAISKVTTADIILKAMEEAGPGQLIWLGGKEPLKDKDYKGVDLGRYFIDMHTLHAEQVKKFILVKELVIREANNLKIGFSAFNGSGNQAFPRLLEELGFSNYKVISELQELDGLFPAFGWGEQPDPGDPISAELIWYRLMKKKELGLLKNSVKHYITFSHVTTDALEATAGLFGVRALGEMRDISGEEKRGLYLDGKRSWVGFTYIADFVNKKRKIGLINEAGAEESNGFSILGSRIKEGEVLADDSHVNDKDGILAGILLAEVACYAKEHNTTLFELLDNIYLQTGHYATANKPLPRVGSFEGAEGITEKINLLKKAQDWMRQANENSKGDNPFILAGLKVIGAIEFKSGRYEKEHYIGFPDEGIRFFFEDKSLKTGEAFYNSKNFITIRPSGTSQTIRFYTQIYSESGELKNNIAEQKSKNFFLAESLALKIQKELLLATRITKYIPAVEEQLRAIRKSGSSSPLKENLISTIEIAENLSIKVLIFDLDGTLYNNKELDIAYAEARKAFLAKKLGCPIDEAVRLFNDKKDELSHKLQRQATGTETLRALGLKVEDWEEYNIREVNPKDFLEKDLQLKEVLKRVSSKYKLAVLTDNNEVQTIRTLEALEIREFFDDKFIFTRDKSGILKPNSEVFKKVVEAIRVRAEECVSIGDRLEIDIKPAQAIGMKGILAGSLEDIYNLEEKLPSSSPVRDPSASSSSISSVDNCQATVVSSFDQLMELLVQGLSREEMVSFLKADACSRYPENPPYHLGHYLFGFDEYLENLSQNQIRGLYTDRIEGEVLRVFCENRFVAMMLGQILTMMPMVELKDSKMLLSKILAPVFTKKEKEFTNYFDEAFINLTKVMFDSLKQWLVKTKDTGKKKIDISIILKGHPLYLKLQEELKKKTPSSGSPITTTVSPWVVSYSEFRIIELEERRNTLYDQMRQPAADKHTLKARIEALSSEIKQLQDLIYPYKIDQHFRLAAPVRGDIKRIYRDICQVNIGIEECGKIRDKEELLRQWQQKLKELQANLEEKQKELVSLKQQYHHSSKASSSSPAGEIKGTAASPGEEQNIELINLGRKIGEVASQLTEQLNSPANILFLGPPGSLKSTIIFILKDILGELNLKVGVVDEAKMAPWEPLDFSGLSKQYNDRDIIFFEMVTRVPA
ncbi:MAG: HAD-IA family hydrolase, partial [Candidatus Aminicenantes bacterium]|nr:HAD-IA family hydrolase [Candidatus Aminicenantes bacterium]